MTNEYNAPYGGYEPNDAIMSFEDYSAAGFAWLMSMWFTPGNSAQRWLEHNQRLARAREWFRRADHRLDYGQGSRLQASGGWIDPGY